jgi:hypothetical protein
VIPEAGVQHVTRSSEGSFVVRTNAGVFRAPLLVNATGCFSNPFTPVFPGARESSLPQFHFANYREAARLREATGKSGGLVLVIGKRLSAGQALVELVDAGFEVALSCRGPIQFGAGPLGWQIFFRIHPALERLKLRLNGEAARGFPAVMPGGRARRLIQTGRVTTHPDVARVENRRVVFSDGRTLEPDAVLYATGFRPALAHLAPLGLALDQTTGQPALRGFESAEVAGLFFLGLDRLRNFRSRFIRGIREDAPLLADELAARARAGGTNGLRSDGGSGLHSDEQSGAPQGFGLRQSSGAFRRAQPIQKRQRTGAVQDAIARFVAPIRDQTIVEADQLSPLA